MPPPPPPPPPPMPLGNIPSRPTTVNRGTLLSEITKGKKLKTTSTNDRSAPIITRSSGDTGNGLQLAPAPSVPVSFHSNGELLPPVSKDKQLTSNADKFGRINERKSGNDGIPQLGSLFTGGIPKLKKRDGGVVTGATSESAFTSDSESSQTSNQGPSYKLEIQNSALSSPFAPSVNNLPRARTYPAPRPVPARGPPPPVGKKPPAPVPGPRKPAGFQASPPRNPAPPSTLPSPPPSVAPRPPANKSPRSKSISPSHSVSTSRNGVGQSLAIQAAIRAAGQSSPSSSLPLAPIPRPPPPAPEATKQFSDFSSVENSEVNSSQNQNTNKHSESSKRLIISDPRWKFQDESMFPKPREFLGGPRKYRAGRGSSVPLDLSSFR